MDLLKFAEFFRYMDLFRINIIQTVYINEARHTYSSFDLQFPLSIQCNVKQLFFKAAAIKISDVC